MRKKILVIILISYAFLVHSNHTSAEEEDLRSYQHGIDLIEVSDESLLLVWSSGGNPPSGEWTHDVFVSLLQRNNPVIRPSVLISRDEAQEPASAAMNSNGNIMVTMEDGWNARNEIAQRYGVYNSLLEPVRAYPQLVLDGGHSGHVASVGSRFVIFYSEGWVDGDGVSNLGSGDDVYATVYSSAGELERTVNVAVGGMRDWWPLVAGSPSTAILVWQRFAPNTQSVILMVAVLDPATGKFVLSPTELTRGVSYYTYSVQYIPSLNRFLIRGSYASGGGFGYLLTSTGTVTGSNTALPSIVRESQPAVRNNGDTVTVVQPRAPSGVSILELSPSSLKLETVQDDGYKWQYMGTDGVFLDSTRAYIVTLSNRGLIEKTYTIPSQKQIEEIDEPVPQESKPVIALPELQEVITDDLCAVPATVLTMPLAYRLAYIQTDMRVHALISQYLLVIWCRDRNTT